MLDFKYLIIKNAQKDLNEKKYYTHINGELDGPYSLDEALIESESHDYIYIELKYEDAIKNSKNLHKIVGDNYG